jgi:hypothetical protein
MPMPRGNDPIHQRILLRLHRRVGNSMMQMMYIKFLEGVRYVQTNNKELGWRPANTWASTLPWNRKRNAK